MEKRILTQEKITAFHAYLHREEKSGATQEKYLRDIRAFRVFLEDREVSKERVLAIRQSSRAGGMQSGPLIPCWPA